MDPGDNGEHYSQAGLPQVQMRIRSQGVTDQFCTPRISVIPGQHCELLDDISHSLNIMLPSSIKTKKKKKTK